MVRAGYDYVRYRETDLWAVPSVHMDVTFADLVSRVCAECRFDVIALELPANVDRSLTDEAVRRLPTPGVAICGSPEPVGRVTGPPAGSALRSPFFPVFRAHIVPLMMSDSIAVAMWASRAVRSPGGGRARVEFVDSPVRVGDADLDPPDSGGRFPESGLVVPRRGLPACLAAAAERRRLSDHPVHRAREREMVRRLYRMLQSGARVLWVGGLAHWQRMTDLLDSGPSAFAGSGTCEPAPPTLQVTVVPVSAAHAWFCGWSGIPAILEDFAHHTLDDRTRAIPFDQASSHAAFEARLMRDTQSGAGDRIAPRPAIAFRAYLLAHHALAGRLPRLDGDYVFAARACVGEPFAEAVKACAVRYAFDPPATADSAVIAEHAGRFYLTTGGRAYDVGGAVNDRVEGREHRSLEVAASAAGTKSGSGHGRWSRVLRSVPSEDRLVRAMLERSWRFGEEGALARRHTPDQLSSARYTGDIGRGLDVRRTLRARARGDEGYFVRKSHRPRAALAELLSRRRGPSRPCPVVWLFAPDGARVSERACGRWFRTISSAYWISDVERLPGRAGVTREVLAWAVHYLRCRTPQGAWNEAAVKAALAATPLDEQPTVEPWEDPEIARRFAGARLAVASAIRWAGRPGNRAVVVADDGFVAGEDVRAYARDRGIELVFIPWREFGAVRRRAQISHVAPAPSYFDDPYPEALRLIPPVPVLTSLSE